MPRPNEWRRPRRRMAYGAAAVPSRVGLGDGGRRRCSAYVAGVVDPLTRRALLRSRSTHVSGVRRRDNTAGKGPSSLSVPPHQKNQIEKRFVFSGSFLPHRKYRFSAAAAVISRCYQLAAAAAAAMTTCRAHG